MVPAARCRAVDPTEGGFQTMGKKVAPDDFRGGSLSAARTSGYTISDESGRVIASRSHTTRSRAGPGVEVRHARRPAGLAGRAAVRERRAAAGGTGDRLTAGSTEAGASPGTPRFYPRRAGR